jgi:hypothetical protein
LLLFGIKALCTKPHDKNEKRWEGGCRCTTAVFAAVEAAAAKEEEEEEKEEADRSTANREKHTLVRAPTRAAALGREHASWAMRLARETRRLSKEDEANTAASALNATV